MMLSPEEAAVVQGLVADLRDETLRACERQALSGAWTETDRRVELKEPGALRDRFEAALLARYRERLEFELRSMWAALTYKGMPIESVSFGRLRNGEWASYSIH